MIEGHRIGYTSLDEAHLWCREMGTTPTRWALGIPVIESELVPEDRIILGTDFGGSTVSLVMAVNPDSLALLYFGVTEYGEPGNLGVNEDQCHHHHGDEADLMALSIMPCWGCEAIV